MDYISIDDFKKVEIRVGEIESAEPVEGSEKLLRLVVNFGDEKRQVVSGIAKFFPDLAQLIGTRCAFATNLEPRKMMGLESQAMILASGGDPVLDAEGKETGELTPVYLFTSDAPLGSRAR